MKKYIPLILKIVLTLLLVSPILGSFGIFPAPTRELYNSDAAFRFIQTIMFDAPYVGYINTIVCILVLFCIWTKREALGALLLLPLVVHILSFHLFLDGGLLKAGAIMANVLFLLTLYFLYQSREQLKQLLHPSL